MKKSFILIYVFLFMALSGKSQSETSMKFRQNPKFIPLKEFEEDTIGYLKHNFIDNKEKYIGKDLNFLLKECEIHANSYFVALDDRNSNHVIALYLSFYSVKNMSTPYRHNLKTPTVIIKWQSVVQSDSVSFLIRNYGYKLEKNTLNFYGNKIIGDLILSPL